MLRVEVSLVFWHDRNNPTFSTTVLSWIDLTHPLYPGPEAPPQLVHGTPVSSTSITITWAPPDRRSQSGVITKYRILYKTLYASPEAPIVSFFVFSAGFCN